MQLSSYDVGSGYDEMFQTSGHPREGSELLFERLEALSSGELRQYQNAAMVTMRNLGITFNVYGHQDGTEKVWPLDIIPRVIAESEWERVERGLAQRVRALNLFVDDIYNDQRILKDGAVPRELIESCDGYRPQCAGLKPPKGIWAHISGTDLVRDAAGTLYVLEDNMRVPSGVSYVLENRAVMKRAFPRVFEGQSVLPVEDYPERLLQMLMHCAPEGVEEPCVVVWTPGIYNSAYFEHSALARQMGVKLVQASDLVTHDGLVHMRTTRGFKRVDVIYRRVDDDFLDPQVFRPNSTLGCHGLMEAYRAGNVAICNAVGTGVADDKSVYPYVPEMIRFYLGQEPILKNVPTWMCRKQDDLQYVLANLKDLVVKEVHGAGGYGMLIGPAATQAEIEDFRRALLANPAGYIAQPTLSLSSCPTYVESGIAPRHIDLRPFVLSGREVQMVAGGLTRVALQEGSLVVNSSQGGGTKDTWVLGNGGTE